LPQSFGSRSSGANIFRLRSNRPSAATAVAPKIVAATTASPNARIRNVPLCRVAPRHLGEAAGQGHPILPFFPQRFVPLHRDALHAPFIEIAAPAPATRHVRVGV